jgi:agmatinase
MKKVVKVPSYHGGMDSRGGSEKGADAVVDVLDDIWLNEDLKIPKYQVSEVKIVDDIKESLKNIAEAEGDIFIGGNHMISYPLFKGFCRKFKNPGIIVFDAHPDVFQYFDDATHADWLKFLVEEKIVKKENIILIGVRNPEEKEIEYLKKNKIKCYFMKEVYKNEEKILKEVVGITKKFDGLYLSLDIDVLDPAFAPGTGYLEPGGMSVRELLYFISKIKKLKNLGRVDINETIPDGVTEKVGAKLLAEFL